MVARHDRVFPEHTGTALHRHWPGSELVVSNASHVTSALLNDAVHARAVVAAFRRAGVVQIREPRERPRYWGRGHEAALAAGAVESL